MLSYSSRNGNATSCAAAKNVFCRTHLPDAPGSRSNSGLGRGMIEQVVYAPEADNDVVESYDWYEYREPGLGEDFLRCVEACVLGIQRHPQLYSVVLDEFRRSLVRRFPFEIFYEPTENCLTI